MKIKLLTALLISAVALPIYGANVSVHLTLTLPADVEAIRMEDLQFARQNFNKIIFVTVFKSETEVPGVFIDFSLRCTKGEILHGQTAQFILPAGACKLTNLDLTLPGSQTRLEEFELLDMAEWLNQQMTQSGYLPPGEYSLTLQLKQAADSIVTLASDAVDITLKNPFGVDLTQPDGNYRNPTQVTLDDLKFAWSSNARRYRITIYNGGYHPIAPPNLKRLPVVLDVGGIQSLRQKSYQPGDTQRQLFQPGKTYYWIVTARVTTSHGEKAFVSRIGAFQIRYSPQDWDQIIASLYQILGDDTLSVLNDISGLTPNGSVRLDGRRIGIAELSEIAAQFQEKQLRKTSVTIE
ncbi:MAG: hypothetical protein ABIE92_15040 [bacterium]|nr:hypothetical protein [bacterium]